LLQLVHECLLVLLQVCNQLLLSSIELVPPITNLNHDSHTTPACTIVCYSTAVTQHVVGKGMCT
jgi:hypothetical protein